MFKTTLFFLLVLVSPLLTISTNAQVSSNHRIIYVADTIIDFNTLLSKFKGKIVYVDIWATWCVPCRKELQLKKETKNFEEYALKNNIVVLYICDDKNGNSWKQFIAANKLMGYHILVNRSINETLHTTFSTIQKRNGVMKKSFYIPRHMIIDQTGNVVDSAAERQGSTSVYFKINKLLAKVSS